jgi:pimeloyl-ACP methyl ester carboxylesterase
MIWKFFLYALAAYLVICLIAFAFQRKMLYFPLKNKISEWHALELGLRYWPAYEDYRGFTSLAEPADPKGTVIVFHGNAGSAVHRDYYLRALSKRSLRVILAEYPGYGGRIGNPSETILVADALETIRLAHQEFGEPLYLWGESLGCGVVSGAVAKTTIPIQGLILFLAYDSIAEVAQTHYGYLPARWFLLDRYDNVANLQGYDGKIAVILAGNDEVIPVRHGQKLYNSLTADKKLWVFEDATHNVMPIGADLPWWEEVIVFVSQ